MTLAQMRAFVAVVETGSFNGAAERLKVTQSGVSHALADLERDLGVLLVERGRRGVSLTEPGQRVLAQVRELLAKQEHIRQEARATPGVVAGRVRLGSVPSVASRLLPKLLAALSRRCPNIEVVLFEGSDDEVREWLVGRAIDVGVVTLPANGLDIVDLVSDEMVAVVPAAHRLARRTKVRLREIAAEPFIMSKGGCEPLIRRMYRAARLAPRVRYDVRDMGTILGMVKEGLGITVVPGLALPEVHAGIAALPLEPSVKRRLALGVPAIDESPIVIKTFLREAASHSGACGAASRDSAYVRASA